MNILYDHQIFEMQQYGGVSRYFSELITRFIQSPEIHPQVAVRITNNHFIHQIDHTYLIPGVLYPHSIRRPIPSEPYAPISQKIVETIRNNVNGHRLHTVSVRNIQNSIDALQKGTFDIFHPTYFSPYFLSYLKGKPFVLTIYDLVHEKFPELYPLQDETIHDRRILLNKAEKIIAISENTKKDIIQFYSIKPDKISVIYLGNEHIAGKMNNPKVFTPFPDNFFLYVGDRNSYKNFPLILEAIAPLLQILSHHHLVCCGGGEYSDSERYFIEKLGLKDKIIHLNGDDETLRMCYQQACALIYPSLYEGFGIPIIEAFHEGCPVVASSIPTSREIAGDAALFFDPKDPESIQESLLKITTDKFQREQLIKSGFERSKIFSWNTTAEKTKEVYALVAHA